MGDGAEFAPHEISGALRCGGEDGELYRAAIGAHERHVIAIATASAFLGQVIGDGLDLARFDGLEEFALGHIESLAIDLLEHRLKARVLFDVVADGAWHASQFLGGLGADASSGAERGLHAADRKLVDLGHR